MGTDRDGSGVSVRVVVAALVVLGGVLYVQQRPYVGLRPPVTEPQQANSVDFQDVDARLWEDPYTAITRHRGEKSRPTAGPFDPHTPGWLGCQIVGYQLGAERRGWKPPVVLGVMVFGGPHLERVEHRRRMRYAVLAGLNASGFEPHVEDHIGYVDFHVDWPTTSEVLKPLPVDMVVPFEWLHSATPGKTGGDLLLLWLDEIALRSRPLGSLNELVGRLTAPCPEKQVTTKASFAVLGPAASTTLARMVRWVDRDRTSVPHLKGMLLYSATATAPASLLGVVRAPGPARPTNVPSTPSLSEPELRDIFKEKEIRFLRTIATDDAVIETIRDALCRRGIRLEQCPWPDRRKDVPNAEKDVPDHVILVSEWDTLYSRKLVDAVKSSFCMKPCPTVHEFSYLSGLEGVAPGTSSGNPGEKNKAGEKGKGEDRDAGIGSSDAFERAEGNSQFDYLRRLVQRIRDKHWELQRERHINGQHGRGIRAIGILGNNPYDKLLVLQALRDDFPGAQFFTTDLDARFAPPSDTRRTRNLLVAASFGLELDPALQRMLPPFRDSYQTSTFLATQLVLKSIEGSEQARATEKAVERWLGQGPRLFEIGRTTAVDLSRTAVTAAQTPQGTEAARRLAALCASGDLLQCSSVYPGPYVFRAPLSPFARRAAPLVLLVGAVLVYAWSWTIRAGVRAVTGRAVTALRRRSRANVILTLATVTVLALLVFMLAADILRTLRDTEEPFALFEGVSIWPSEILRALALLLNIVFLVLVAQRATGCTSDLTDRFFRGYKTKGMRLPDLLSWRAWRRAFAGPRPPAERAEPRNAESLWKEHVFQASPVALWVRVLTMALLFVGLGALLIGGVFTRPIQFMRAPGDRWLIGLSTALFFLLVAWVVDAIRLCDKFTQELSHPDQTALARRDRTEWPPATRDRAREELGLPKTGDAAVASWISMQMIGRWTERIGPLVYYPFVTLGLMVVARSPLLANWDMPVGIYVVFGLSAAYMVIAAHTLRRLAERTRRLALENLDNEIVAATGRESDRGLASQLKLLRDNVERMRDGAFAPFTQQPILKAFLVPVMSYGGLALLEYLMRS